MYQELYFVVTYFSLVVSLLHSLFGCGDYTSVTQLLADSQKVALTQVLC
jgi:hypothetical protein